MATIFGEKDRAMRVASGASSGRPQDIVFLPCRLGTKLKESCFTRGWPHDSYGHSQLVCLHNHAPRRRVVIVSQFSLVDRDFFHYRRVVVTEYPFHDSSLIGLPSVLDNTDVAFAHVALGVRPFWTKCEQLRFTFHFWGV